MRDFALVVCLLAVTACDQDAPTAPPVPVDRQFTLAPGQSQTIAEVPVAVKFTGVTGDSRCPADAVCVTGGSATVNLEVARSGGSARHELRTGSMQPVRVGDLTIQLVEVSPYPFSTKPVAPADYRVTLRVTR